MKSLILATALMLAPVDRAADAWIVLSGQDSLDAAWQRGHQRGYDQHIMDSIDEWAGEGK